ncbi:MAG: CHASE2 domain-containing protein, partial [Spirochaetales bacterium]|nr:CHASE2 domain-containing protein [Spirochaetales bacterium]
MQDYAATRVRFFNNVAAFLNGDAEKKILGDIDTALAAPGLSLSQKRDYEETRTDAVKIFGDTAAIFKQIQELRASLKKELAGSFCIIGDTATSTTDIGVNPFQSRYMNVGTHAAVVNTILSGQFLRELPWIFPLVAGALLAFLLAFVIRSLRPAQALITGFATVLIMLAVSILSFTTTGLFIPVFGPILIVLTTFIGVAMLQFLTAEQEKSFYRTAFGHYLSADVIDELVNNPDKLKLGGEKKTISAIFTDVQGFSSISEVLDPGDLVKLLNIYLTTMSDLVLDLSGTIDKYEGDAIIAFFGAPLDLADHAQRACLAGVRMKRAEKELNVRFREEKLSPHPLLTRIGINTGEMIVGNMGTLKKMDYTIMGNAVNLASRLEGVNKQYGTWVLTSEASYKMSGDLLLARRLDKVRVVGISNPVRLYELIEEKSLATPGQIQMVEAFHTGLESFEAKDWAKAETLFQEVLRLAPNDGPSQFFSRRCAEFKKKPPVENWDGVFNLTTK